MLTKDDGAVEKSSWTPRSHLGLSFFSTSLTLGSSLPTLPCLIPALGTVSSHTFGLSSHAGASREGCRCVQRKDAFSPLTASWRSARVETSLGSVLDATEEEEEAMEERTMEALAQRLEKMERQHHRLKLMGVVVLVLTTTALLMGQALPKSQTVEAERVILRDVNGKLRARLAVDTDGRPDLLFYDEAGKLRTRVGIEPKGVVGLVVYDPDEKRRVVFGVGRERATGVSFLDADGKHLVFIEVTPEGYPHLILKGKDGTSGAKLDMTSEGHPHLAFLDKDGYGAVPDASGLFLADKDRKERVRFGLAPDGSPSLVLLDANGKVLFQAP